jgi:hypothetical protein
VSWDFWPSVFFRQSPDWHPKIFSNSVSILLRYLPVKFDPALCRIARDQNFSLYSPIFKILLCSCCFQKITYERIFDRLFLYVIQHSFNVWSICAMPFWSCVLCGIAQDQGPAICGVARDHGPVLCRIAQDIHTNYIQKKSHAMRHGTRATRHSAGSWSSAMPA